MGAKVSDGSMALVSAPTVTQGSDRGRMASPLVSPIPPRGFEAGASEADASDVLIGCRGAPQWQSCPLS